MMQAPKPTLNKVGPRPGVAKGAERKEKNGRRHRSQPYTADPQGWMDASRPWQSRKILLQFGIRHGDIVSFAPMSAESGPAGEVTARKKISR